jgi:hypothetical protein
VIKKHAIGETDGSRAFEYSYISAGRKTVEGTRCKNTEEEDEE